MEKYTKEPYYKVEWSSDGIRLINYVSAVSVLDAIEHVNEVIEVNGLNDTIIHSVSEYVEEVEKPLPQDTYEGDILAFEQSLFGE